MECDSHVDGWWGPLASDVILSSCPALLSLSLKPGFELLFILGVLCSLPEN